MGADPKVRGVDAGPIVACVHDVHVRGHFAAPVGIGDPMSAPDDARGVGAVLGGPIQDAVSVGVLSAFPIPASGFRDFVIIEDLGEGL